jgi:spermidine/putrescine transport system ATP-binding protein
MVVDRNLTETETAVSLKAITKRYGAVVAVDGLDLDVRQGEFLTLLGPSGCGKTTTLRIIGGFEQPDQGDVFIAGVKMTNRPPHRRPVNTVFQHYALFPHLTVFENVGYGLMHARRLPRDVVERTVKEMLDLVRLTEVEGRKPRELSGGQQQRVALARALALRPEVLLLDEPLGSLDYKLRKEMQVELKQIHRSVGASFVYVTHDQEEAMSMSDRICVMANGHVVQEGSPREIYERPATRYVAGFVGDMSFVDGRVVSRNGSLATVAVEGLGEVRVDGLRTDVSEGDGVVLGIRPEDAQLAPDRSQEAPNLFRGRCLEQLVVGPATITVVQHGPHRIRVEVRGAGAVVQPGEDVWTVWPPGRVHLFKEP